MAITNKQVLLPWVAIRFTMRKDERLESKNSWRLHEVLAGLHATGERNLACLADVFPRCQDLNRKIAGECIEC